jgi:hypothetical protein
MIKYDRDTSSTLFFKQIQSRFGSSFIDISQILHVCNLCLHLPQKMPQMSNVGKYSTHGASRCIKKDHNAMYRHDIWISYDRPMTVRRSRRHVTSMVCSFIQRYRAAVEFHEMWKPMESRWKSWWFGEKTVKTMVKTPWVCSFLMFGKSIRIAPGFPFLGG